MNRSCTLEWVLLPGPWLGPGVLSWRGVRRVDSGADGLWNILRAMARGDDVWREFIDLLGRFIFSSEQDGGPS